MGIVHSEYLVGHPQVDGRHYVNETHTDHLGRTHEREYLASPGTDYEAVLAESAQSVWKGLKATQLEAIETQLFSGQNPFPPDNADFDYVSRAEVLGYLFGKYMDAPAQVIVKVAPLISAVSDAEMMAFGMSEAMVAGVRARVAAAENIKAQIDAYNSAVGT